MNPFYHPSETATFLPPLSQLVRGVTLWADYFLRWAPLSVIAKSSGSSFVQSRNSTNRDTISLTSSGGDATVSSMVTTMDYWEEQFHGLESKYTKLLSDTQVTLF